MKKIITAVAFFALTLGVSNTMVAQSFAEKDAMIESKAYVKSFTKSLNLTAEQEVAMYNANMLKLRKTASARNTETKNEINTVFAEKVKTILNEKQYKKYLKSNK